jgi:glutamyl-tRNA synthetase/glutamyl-Q tRNA(Asp) synthetase
VAAIVSRFAPAPTGFLHLGHVVNAIYVWGVTRAAGGRVLLRIEDHDRARSRPFFERSILDDLEWLGFMPDGPEIAAFRAGPCDGRQSNRTAVYESALETLRSRGLVYECECSRTGIARALRRPVAGPIPSDPSERRYPGTCACKGLPPRADRGSRVRLAPGVERFDDWRHGVQEQRPAEQCGDLLARDRAGNWTYQFAVTVDDDAQGVTLVIRGDDLLPSTGRQLQLARLLGRSSPPAFLHHPLVMKSRTQKLSKADGDTSVRDLRRAGQTPADVIGEAARLAGLVDGRRPLTVDQAAAVVGPIFARSQRSSR